MVPGDLLGIAEDAQSGDVESERAITECKDFLDLINDSPLGWAVGKFEMKFLVKVVVNRAVEVGVNGDDAVAGAEGFHVVCVLGFRGGWERVWKR